MLSASLNGGAESAQDISQSRYWKLLLHYRAGWFSEKSEADGKDFFLSPKGNIDPMAELAADVLAFSDPHSKLVGFLHQHAQCAFPERFRFLREKLDLKFRIQPCPDFNSWKNQFHAQSLTLIFAAPYLGSPASMFGHTFLRVDSKARPGQTQKNDLLDYGISFEAVTGSDQASSYVIKGLLGFYPGVFTQNAFYLKINTYSSMESRDLWEYHLNLNAEQIDHFLNHLWETGTTDFNYYFFNRNCSYQLLSLLEIANPQWHLREKFGPMAIPIDTVRAVKDLPGAVKSVTVRPSLIKIIEQEMSQLSENERQRFILGMNDISAANKTDSARTLDVLMDWQKYSAMTNSLTADEAETKIDQSLLILRAQNAQASSPLLENNLVDIEEPPESGHPSSKLSLATGLEGSNNFWGLELRPAFHDLLDSDQGYLPRSTLIIARIRASFLFSGINKIRLDDFTMGEVTSFVPLSRLMKPLSWTLSGGLTRPLDMDCFDCVAGYFQGGLGYTLSLSHALSITSLLTGHAEISQFFDRFNGQFYRGGPGAMLLTILEISKAIKFIGSFEHIRYVPGADVHFLSKLEGGLSLSLKRLGLPKYEFRLQGDSFVSSFSSENAFTLTSSLYF